MKVTGKIENILDTKTGTTKAGKDWKKTSFLVKTEKEYNNLYCFDIFGVEKVDKFLQYNSKGDVVEVDFDVVTKEWNNNYYTSLNAWKVFKANNNKQEESVVEEESDLPF
jgi:hypothetical protein